MPARSRQDGAVRPAAYCRTGPDVVKLPASFVFDAVPSGDKLTLGGRLFRGNHMSLMNKYPRLTDLEAPAARRIPKFVFAYLDSGTGQDQAKDHNRAYLDGVELTPQFMRGRVNPDLTTKLFGNSYNAPFGVAPIGLSSVT